jgi:hypothetical protein
MAAIARHCPADRPNRFEHQPAVPGADVKLIVVGVEQFDAILHAFRERHAMPDLLMRSVCARLAPARPAGNFEPGPARSEPLIDQPVFDLFHENSRAVIGGTRTDICRNEFPGDGTSLEQIGIVATVRMHLTRNLETF